MARRIIYFLIEQITTKTHQQNDIENIQTGKPIKNIQTIQKYYYYYY